MNRKEREKLQWPPEPGKARTRCVLYLAEE